MTKKELQERIFILETENADLNETIKGIASEALKSGETLKESLFMPEYLGFEETVQRSKIGEVEARIYTRDGFNIARPVDTKSKHWIILPPGKPSINLLITNMYNAIVILHACGMDISIETYFEFSANQFKDEDDELEGIQKELEAEMNSIKKNISPLVFKALETTHKLQKEHGESVNFYDLDNSFHIPSEDGAKMIVNQLAQLNLIYFTDDGTEEGFKLVNDDLEANREYLIEFLKGTEMEGKIEGLEKISEEK